jgi:hypothetical protein
MEATWRADFGRVGKVLGLSVEQGFTWSVDWLPRGVQHPTEN